MEDELTQEQMSEKAKWFDTLHDLGFVWEGNVKNKPNSTSSWRHKNISGLVVHLGLITAESHPHCGHFEAMISIERSWPDAYVHLNAASPDKLVKLYDLIIGVKRVYES